MARRKKVYEGKTKILYDGPEPGTLIQYFKDDSPVAEAAVQPDGEEGAAPTATSGRVKSLSKGNEGKGVLNNRLSEFFMTGLNGVGVPTHFLKRVNMREQLVRMAEMLPLEVVVRNFAAGEMSQRLGIPEGTALPRPIVEYYYKDDRLNTPLVSEEHIIAFGWATQQDLDDMIALALRVNDFMSGLMLGIGVRLADFRIELGRIYEGDYMRLIVADEISPDSCRLWDMRPVVGRGDGQVVAEPGPLENVHTELARRLGVLPSNVTHSPKPSLIN